MLNYTLVFLYINVKYGFGGSNDKRVFGLLS